MNGFVDLLLALSIEFFQAEIVYIARVQLTGSVHDVGVEGKRSLTGPGGVCFTLHETGATEANPETSPMLKFLYSP